MSDKTIPPEIKDIHYFTGNAKYYVPVIGDEPGTIKRWALKKQHHIFLKYKNKDSAFDHLYL